jgi:FAD/FMN-containing dehydrogenase
MSSATVSREMECAVEPAIRPSPESANEPIQIDSHSRVVRVQSHVSFGDLSAALAKAGLTLGISLSPELLVGDAIRQPRALHRSPKYGRLIDACLAMELRDSRGLIGSTSAPRRATGPDWRALVVGNPSATISIASVVLRVSACPATRENFAFTFTSRAAALRCARLALRSEVAPATWMVTQNALQGRLEGLPQIVELERKMLIRAAGDCGATAAPFNPTKIAPARFVTWTELLSSPADAAEMAFQGGCLLGEDAAPATLPFVIPV